jgi:hypothetical protein
VEPGLSSLAANGERDCPADSQAEEYRVDRGGASRLIGSL